MYSKEYTTAVPIDLFNLDQDQKKNELHLSSTHFNNYILLQIRFNGELDTTYEISQKGLRSVSFDNPLAGSSLSNDKDDSEEDEDLGFTMDNLSDYDIVTKLGNSNDMKLPVICTQLVELYNKVIIPQIISTNELHDSISNNKFIITLNSKIWNSKFNATNSTTNDFNKLVFILNCIKNMYSN